jgi:predicted nucleic acid-binding protein
LSAADFFDTNILIYAVMGGDPRSVIANDALAQGGTISVQVLNEFTNVARRKYRRSWPEIIGALADIRALCSPPLPLTAATHERAVALAAAHSLAFYDALIIASALGAGCNTLLSEDMQHGQVIDGRMIIRNPFQVG